MKHPQSSIGSHELHNRTRHSDRSPCRVFAVTGACLLALAVIVVEAL